MGGNNHTNYSHNEEYVDNKLKQYMQINKQISKTLTWQRIEIANLKKLLRDSTSEMINYQRGSYKWKHKFDSLRKMYINHIHSISSELQINADQLNSISDFDIDETENPNSLASRSVASVTKTSRRADVSYREGKSFQRAKNRTLRPNVDFIDTIEEENEVKSAREEDSEEDSEEDEDDSDECEEYSDGVEDDKNMDEKKDDKNEKDMKAEDTIEGETTTEDTTAENTTAENTTADNTNEEDTTAEDTTAENTTADNTNEEDTTAEDIIEEDVNEGIENSNDECEDSEVNEENEEEDKEESEGESEESKVTDGESDNESELDTDASSVVENEDTSHNSIEIEEKDISDAQSQSGSIEQISLLTTNCESTITNKDSSISTHTISDNSQSGIGVKGQPFNKSTPLRSLVNLPVTKKTIRKHPIDGPQNKSCENHSFVGTMKGQNLVSSTPYRHDKTLVEKSTQSQESTISTSSRPRRKAAPVILAEPKLNTKMRRPLNFK